MIDGVVYFLWIDVQRLRYRGLQRFVDLTFACVDLRHIHPANS